jgi:hypothetical protein
MIPTEFYNWWITDECKGERRLTTYKLTRADAKRAFPGAEPDLRASCVTYRRPGRRRRPAGREESGASPCDLDRESRPLR